MFGIEIADAAFLPAATVALIAGILSFLSPCVLPVVPPYLAYMTGVGVGGLRQGERSAVVPALFFILGLSTVFLLMGMAASAFGRLFLQWQDWLARGSGLVVIVMGLHFLRVIRIPFLDSEARIDAGDKGGSSFGAYVLGLAFAFGWTPCIGPVLAAILAVAGSTDTVGRGAGLLAIYSLGLGIPFMIAAGFAERFIGGLRRFRPYMPMVEKVMGVFLIVAGILFLTGQMTAMSFWLLETFPALSKIG